MFKRNALITLFWSVCSILGLIFIKDMPVTDLNDFTWWKTIEGGSDILLEQFMVTLILCAISFRFTTK